MPNCMSKIIITDVHCLNKANTLTLEGKREGRRRKVRGEKLLKGDEEKGRAGASSESCQGRDLPS